MKDGYTKYYLYLSNMLTNNEYEICRNFLAEKMEALLIHENKGFARVGFPAQNFKSYNKRGRAFYFVSTNTFRSIFEEFLISAACNHPTYFGTQNALGVLCALNKELPLYNKLKKVVRYYRKENFCIILEINQGIIEENILRIDLFRHLKPNKKNRKICDFTGGIFHALKHFSYENRPLSTGSELNNLNYPHEIIELIIQAFYMPENKLVHPNEYKCYIILNENTDLKFGFYHEVNTGVFFLNTVHPQKKTKTKKDIIEYNLEYNSLLKL